MVFLISIVVFLFLAGFLCMYWIYFLAFRPPKKREDDYLDLPKGDQYRKYDDETIRLCKVFAAIPYESVCITSVDGYKLYARYYEVEKGADLQIECHGYHGSPIRDFCGGNRIARESGYNTLVIEQRGMLRSGGNAITFGIMERWDIRSWCHYAYERFGKDIRIVLSGISMGASAVLMASSLDLPDNVSAIIADCPYSSPLKIIRKVGSGMGLPVRFLTPLVILSARIFGGFDIRKSTPLEAVEKTDIPILLIHGQDDRFVPYEMSEELKRANSKIRLEGFPGAGHGLSYMLDTPRYERIVREFLSDAFGGI